MTPDFVLAFVILDVMLIIVVARAVGYLFRRMGQPMVVGEILAGVLLGPTLLGPTLFHWGAPFGFLHCDASLAPTGAEPSITTCVFPPQARSILGVLGQVALILFMFLVGAELDFDTLKGKAKGIASVALSVILVPVGLGLLLGPVLYDEKWVGGFGTPAQPSKLAFALMVGAMLAVTAFPVMARILQEKGLTQTPMGSTGIASTAVVSILMFLTVALATGVARSESAGSMTLRFAGAAIYLAVMFLVVKPALRPVGEWYARNRTVTPELFAGMLLLGFASAYVADRIGINVIVGAFVGGAVLPAPRRELFHEVSSRLSLVTTAVLLPIFLAVSGLNTDFTKLGASFIVGIALFLIAGIVGKWAAGAVGARLAGLSWAEGNVLGVLMNCRGLLVLVVGLIALNSGVVTPALQVGGVLMALITTAMTGPLFDKFIKRVEGVAPATPTVAEEAPIDGDGAAASDAAVSDGNADPGSLKSPDGETQETPT